MKYSKQREAERVEVDGGILPARLPSVIGGATVAFALGLIVACGGDGSHPAAPPGDAGGDTSSESGGTLSLSVATTPTQAVLSYTAPSNGSCTIKVSEETALSPLAHDVDPSLFAGADSDARPGSLVDGAHRIFVVGKRAVAKASDGNNYSLSLQANTTHHYRITCGDTVAEGTFTTANIPLGNTYSDLPPTLAPTLSLTDRAQVINDPATGAQIRRLSLFGDQVSDYSPINGPFMNYGGFTRMCGNTLIGPGPGFLCAFPNGDGASGLLYYVIPSTGEARFLGVLGGFAYPKVDALDNKLYHVNGSGFMARATYTGDYSGAARNAQASLSDEVFIPSTVSDLVLAFDPSFQTYGSGGGFAVEGKYAVMTFGKSYQDSYGSVAVLDMGNRMPIGSCGSDPKACPHVIAAAPISEVPAARWCGLHNIALIPDEPLVNLEFHGLVGPAGKAGFGPYYSKLTASVAIGQTAITVDGEPTSPGAPDAHWMDASVGDWVVLSDGSGITEEVQITGKSDSQHWTVTRTASNTFGSGSNVGMQCPGHWLAYWKFLDDPTGMDTTNTRLVMDPNWPLGGHDDWGPNIRLTEGYLAVKGPILENLGKPTNFSLTSSPTFAGVRGIAYGNSYTAHPSYHQHGVSDTDYSWFLDMLPFIGGDGFNDPVTPVTGQLYKTSFGTKPIEKWNRKVMASIVLSGAKMFTDISGPGSSISDTAADANHYCVAVAAGECRKDSAVGDIFVNAPNLTTPQCTPNYIGSANDICIANMPSHGQAVVQLGLTPTDNDAYSRILTNGFVGFRDMFAYATAKSLPDASYAMFGYQSQDLWDTGHAPAWTAQQTNAVFLVKLPPYVSDSVDRSTFVRVPLSIAAPTGMGIATATVEFGYAEQGLPTQYYCTSRREACVVATSTVTDSNPFWYEKSETYARGSCASSCTLTLPLLPSHVAYWQIKFYDASGGFVANGPQGTATEAGAVVLP